MRRLWTQERLAEQAGVSGRTISDIERGVHANARLTTLERVARAMELTEVETQQLLGLAAAPPRRDEHGAARVDSGAQSARLARASAASEIGAWNVAVEEYTALTRELRVDRGADTTVACDALLGLGRSATLALRRHDARPAFVRAAQLAIALGDRTRLLTAAAGYSFMTKAGDAVADADETWRTGLLGVADTDTEARTLLTAARATVMYLDGRFSAASELARYALDLARGTASPDALAVAISVYSMSTWGAPNASERLELANELRAITGTSLDHVELAGVELAAYPSLELGDVDRFADCARHLRAEARASRHPYALAQAEMWDATLALLRDEFVAAEQKSANAVSLSGHAPNFTDGHLAQLFSIRYAQDRAVELLDGLARSVATNPKEVAWRAAWAATAATVSELHGDVRRSLARVRLEMWPLARTWTLPVTMAFLADAAWRVGDTDLSRLLVDELAPYSGRFLVVSTSTSCEGAADHYLGLAALGAGDHGRGIALLEAGRAAHERIASPHLVARSDAALATATR
jgi:transcriptional regulator with XRE-family HTH domain